MVDGWEIIAAVASGRPNWLSSTYNLCGCFSDTIGFHFLLLRCLFSSELIWWILGSPHHAGISSRSSVTPEFQFDPARSIRRNVPTRPDGLIHSIYLSHIERVEHLNSSRFIHRPSQAFKFSKSNNKTTKQQQQRQHQQQQHHYYHQFIIIINNRNNTSATITTTIYASMSTTATSITNWSSADD